MWGGHWLESSLRNPSQNSRKCVNPQVIIGRGSKWSPLAGIATSHISSCNWARFSATGPSRRISSSDSQWGCIWSSKVHPELCFPSGPMAPNSKCGRYAEAATSIITGWKLLQGSAPFIHKLCQPHTHRTHPEPLRWSWNHLNHGHRGEWSENEKIMVAPRPNVGTIWENWKSSRVCRSR